MNKNCKMTIGAMLLLTTAFSVAEVRAQTCVVPPTCEGLGYDKTASDCGGLAKLRCPFDDSKYFCTAYMNPDGSAPVAVGDIVYSDGSYANPEISQPTKTPIGVIYNSNGGYFVALEDFGSFGYYQTISCSGYTTGAKNWSVPTENQLKEMYKNITTLNASIDLFAKTRLEGEYAYGTASSTTTWTIRYVNMSTGKSGGSIEIKDTFPTRCVNTLANITPTTEPYKVGDSYIKNGVAIGTIVALDSSGKHGTIAFNAGSATATDATSICAAKNTGGLAWALATGPHACTLLKNVGGCEDINRYQDYPCSSNINVSYQEITCGLHTSSGRGRCLSSQWMPLLSNQGKVSCETSDLLSVVCEAAF